MTHTHDTAPTQYVEANGFRFAYRRFGKAGGVPIVFNQHYAGTMDYWDPAVTDGLAETREVILFNNAGVSSSSGETPTSFPEMGANAIAFIRAVGLKQVDVLGISIASTCPWARAIPATTRRPSRSAEIFAGRYEPAEHLWLSVHFAPSDAS